jgi:Flp pilus assembly pilin Flp
MARASLNQKGQTAVEYIFLIAVLAAVITSTLSLIKNRYLGDATKCVSAAQKKTLLCKINGLMSDNGLGKKKFQYYPFKK